MVCTCTTKHTIREAVFGKLFSGNGYGGTKENLSPKTELWFLNSSDTSVVKILAKVVPILYLCVYRSDYPEKQREFRLARNRIYRT